MLVLLVFYTCKERQSQNLQQENQRQSLQQMGDLHHSDAPSALEINLSPPHHPPSKKTKKETREKKLAAVTQDICEVVPEQRTGELEVTLWLWAVSED